MMTRYEILKHRCENASKRNISEFAKGAFLAEIINMSVQEKITDKQADECLDILKIDRQKYSKEIDEFLAIDEDDNIDVGD